MKTKSNGSVIILILVITASMTIIMATAIKAVVVFYTLALERKEYVCQIRALEALTFYGIALGQTIDHNKQDRQEYHQTFQSWPLKKGYQATVIVMMHPNEYVVNAQLSGQNNQMLAIESRVVREKNTWRIAQWGVV